MIEEPGHGQIHLSQSLADSKHTPLGSCNLVQLPVELAFDVSDVQGSQKSKQTQSSLAVDRLSSGGANAIRGAERGNNELALQPVLQGQRPPLTSVADEPDGKSIDQFFSSLQSCCVGQPNHLRAESEERGSSPDCVSQIFRRQAEKQQSGIDKPDDHEPAQWYNNQDAYEDSRVSFEPPVHSQDYYVRRKQESTDRMANLVSQNFNQEPEDNAEEGEASSDAGEMPADYVLDLKRTDGVAPQARCKKAYVVNFTQACEPVSSEDDLVCFRNVGCITSAWDQEVMLDVDAEGKFDQKQLDVYNSISQVFDDLQKASERQSTTQESVSSTQEEPSTKNQQLA